MSRSMRWCRSGEMSTNKMHFGIEKQYGTNNYKLWSMTFTMNPVKSPAQTIIAQFDHLIQLSNISKNIEIESKCLLRAVKYPHTLT